MDALPLLYNPRAGGGRASAAAKAAVRLLAQRGIQVRPHPTARAGAVRDEVHRLAAEGAPRILVLGGDGTHSEACEGLLRAGALAASRCALGLLPAGTGNDLLLAFGAARMEAAVERVARGAPAAMDVGRVAWSGGSRHFLSVFGTGFVADVAAFADRRLKLLGRASYTAAVPFVLARLRATRTTLDFDGRTLEGRFSLVAICNTPFAGAGMRFAPEASPTDGLLDVIAFEGERASRVLRLLPKLRRGTHVDEPDVLVERARRIRIGTETPQGLLGDGEPYGSTPVTVEALAGALRIL